MTSPTFKPGWTLVTDVAKTVCQKKPYRTSRARPNYALYISLGFCGDCCFKTQLTMLEKVSRSPSQGAAWEENNVPSHILGRKQCAKPISSGKKTMCQATFSTGLPGGGQHQIAQFSACTILKMESSSTSVARTDILWSKMSFFHQILRNLQKAMATHSSTVAWRIPWTEELVGCSQRSWEESDMTERLHFHFSLSCMGKEMETYSSILAWRIPGTEEPGGLPSVGSHRVGYN